MKKTKLVPHFDVEDIGYIRMPTSHEWLNVRERDDVPNFTGEWWLGNLIMLSNGNDGRKFVIDGGLISSQDKELTEKLGIRPIVTIAIKQESNFGYEDVNRIPMHSKVEIGSKIFTKITATTFLCDSVIAKSPFLIDATNYSSPMDDFLNSDEFKEKIK